MFSNYNLRKTLLSLGVPMAVWIMAGCTTPTEPPTPTPVSGHDIQVFLSQGRNPEIFGVYVHKTGNGAVARKACTIKGSRKALLEFSSGREPSLPIVEAEAKRAEFEMLFDTSSRKSWTTFGLARTMGLVPVGKKNPIRYTAEHVQDDIPGFFCIAPELQFNKMTVTEGLVYARADAKTLWPVSRDFRYDNIEMVMGSGMMKAFAFVRFDFKNRTVALSGSDPYSLSNRRIVTSIPIEWTNGAVALKAEIDGEEQLVYLDTGGTFELAFPDAKKGKADSLKIGQIEVQDVDIVSGEKHRIAHRDHPSIGVLLLKDLAITIDNVEQMVHFELP